MNIFNEFCHNGIYNPIINVTHSSWTVETFNLFQPSVAFYIETKHLMLLRPWWSPEATFEGLRDRLWPQEKITDANQMTGFFMNLWNATLGWNGLAGITRTILC